MLITDFTQTNPVEGAAPTEQTEVRIAYDADHLYFAFYAHYTDPTQMRRTAPTGISSGGTTGSR